MDHIKPGGMPAFCGGIEVAAVAGGMGGGFDAKETRSGAGIVSDDAFPEPSESCEACCLCDEKAPSGILLDSSFGLDNASLDDDKPRFIIRPSTVTNSQASLNISLSMPSDASYTSVMVSLASFRLPGPSCMHSYKNAAYSVFTDNRNECDPHSSSSAIDTACLK